MLLDSNREIIDDAVPDDWMSSFDAWRSLLSSLFSLLIVISVQLPAFDIYQKRSQIPFFQVWYIRQDGGPTLRRALLRERALVHAIRSRAVGIICPLHSKKMAKLEQVQTAGCQFQTCRGAIPASHSAPADGSHRPPIQRWPSCQNLECLEKCEDSTPSLHNSRMCRIRRVAYPLSATTSNLTSDFASFSSSDR